MFNLAFVLFAKWWEDQDEPAAQLPNSTARNRPKINITTTQNSFISRSRSSPSGGQSRTSPRVPLSKTSNGGITSTITVFLLFLPSQSFFTKWWAEQDEPTRAIVKDLVASGRLDFVNGGFVQNDEAASHYASIIDQATLGHRCVIFCFQQ